jgi:predicted acylesterase/phospholipase RssA
MRFPPPFCKMTGPDRKLKFPDKSLVWLMLLCCAAGGLPAQENRVPEPAGGEAPPKIALVLSGGAALGFAHVGFLKVLEEVGIPIDLVIGNSMGSLVGALYACGYSPSDIEETAKEINWAQIFLNEGTGRNVNLLSDRLPFLSLTFDKTVRGNSRGLLPDQNITLLLSRLVYRLSMVENFSDLPLQFKTIAVDIAGGMGVPLDRAPLYRAMRSSMSIPLIFPPAAMNGTWLVDGAIVNNNPIDLALEWGADIIIDVDVGSFSPKKPEEIDSFETVINQTIRLIQSTGTIPNIVSGREDYRLNMDLGEFFWTDFARYQELIDRGEINARSLESMEALLALADRIAEKRPLNIRNWRRRGNYRDLPFPVFKEARLLSINADGFPEAAHTNTEKLSPKYIDSLFDEFLNVPADFNKLETVIEIVRRRGNYESVGYHLERLETGEYALVLTAVRNRQRNNDFTLAMDAAYSFGHQANLAMTEYAALNFRDILAPASLLSLNAAYAFSQTQGPLMSLAYTQKMSPFISLRAGAEGAYYASSVHGFKPQGELSTFGFANTEAAFIYNAADALDLYAAYRYAPLWYQNSGFNAGGSASLDQPSYSGDLHLARFSLVYNSSNIKQPPFLAFLSDTVVDFILDIPFAGSMNRTPDKFRWYERIDLAVRKSWTPRSWRNLIFDLAIGSYRGELESIWTLHNPAGKNGIPGYSGNSVLGRDKLIFGCVYLEEIKPLSNFFHMRTFFTLTLRGGNVWDNFNHLGMSKEFRGGARMGLQIETPIGTLFCGPECSFDGKFQFTIYYN